MKFQNYLLLGLFIGSMMSCNPDEEPEETPDPTPAPTYNADQTPKYTLTLAGDTETQTDGQNNYIHNSGSDFDYTLNGDSYRVYYSQLTLDGLNLSLMDSDRKGFVISANKTPHSDQLLTDQEFINLFQEGTYNLTGWGQSSQFSVAFFDENGRQANSSDAIGGADDQVEILDAIPEVVNGVQTVKVYMRFTARVVNLFGPGAGQSYTIQNGIYVGVFRNE